ncbi:MAG: TIR domain-containing protein, partial [Anaerolineae bacterium]
MSREIQYDVFLSHSDADNAAVELIAQRLREEAGLAPFLDSWHLIPGRPWMDEVEKALAQSLTVAVFVGPSGISPWHNEEMRAALDEAVRTRDEVRVIPVLLPGATEASVSRFLARRVWVDFRPGLDDGEAFQRLVAGIKGEAIVGGVYELPDEPAPYRGLLRFEAEHTRFFFGREADRRRLVEKLEEDTFVAVVGASGSGKSSLVRAGLLPALARGALPGSDQWHTLVFQPGGQPLRTLAEQVATLVPIAHRLEAADDLTGRLSERADGLRTAATTYLADRPGSLLLVVDQFEELFTLCREKPEACRARVEQFIANLADAVENGEGRIRILITLRADFLDRCLAFPALRDLLQNRQVLLGPLDEAALREVIVRPAQEVGAFFEKGLVSMVLRDVEDKPGALPLLQHALYELWRARRGPWLTIDAYEASGGVEGALQRRAQATYESLTPEQQVIARNILLRLTALGEGIADTRRRVERDELYLVGVVREQVDAVLQALSGEKTRLVVAGEESVEVAHEALIQSWSTLRGWLEEDREELLIHRRLTQASEEWDEDEREESYLYHGARLAQAEEWAASHGGELNPLEQEFLEASVAARRARQMAARRRVRYTVAGLAIAVVILATLAFIAFQQWRRSDRNARALETSVAVSETSQAVAEAERNSAQGQASRLLAEQSLSQLDADYDLALLLAIASGRTAGTFEAEAALHEALFRRGRIWVLAGHDGPLKQMAWDGAGSRLATAGEDGTARIWDADSRQELAVLQGHRGSIEHIAWSPDYQRLVTAGVDGTARIWDA